MSKATRLLLVLLALLGLGAVWALKHGTPHGQPTEPRSEPAARVSHSGDLSVPYVRAAHWFGEGWPVNHWNTRLESHADADFRRLAQDGFNTLVLLVPWPGFAPQSRSGELDAERVQRLLELMRLADKHGLQVILRVSYAWDSLSGDAGSRLLLLWHDLEVWQGWLEHLEQLWLAVGGEPNLLFGFFSWEDLWAPVSVSDAPLETRLASARSSGYQDWLRDRLSLEEVARAYRQDFEDWTDVPVPARREPAFKQLLRFLDHAWLERFFLPAQARFPKLSMEVRIDSDPVWDGDQLLEWHSHDSAWSLPGAEWTTLYWSPAMGGENQGESLEPMVATERLQWMLQRVLEHTGGRPIFIGQFLAEDYTPGYERNGRIPKERVGEFLQAAAAPLQQLTAGYGLWTWRDYGHDVVANPEFAAGLARWDSEGAVVLREGMVELAAGAALGSQLSIHQYHAPGGPAEADVCVEGEPLEGSESLLRLVDRHAGERLARLRLSATGEARACASIAVRGFMQLWLEAEHPLRLRRVTSIGFVQHSGMRDVDAVPKAVAPAYVALNRKLQEARFAEQRQYADGWMGRSMSQYLPHPGSMSAVLRFSTHLPPSWPVSPKLSVAIDGRHLSRVECVDGQDVELPVRLTSPAAQWLRLRMESSHLSSPENDQRQLGCLVRGLELTSISESGSAHDSH